VIPVAATTWNEARTRREAGPRPGPASRRLVRPRRGGVASKGYCSRVVCIPSGGMGTAQLAIDGVATWHMWPGPCAGTAEGRPSCRAAAEWKTTVWQLHATPPKGPPGSPGSGLLVASRWSPALLETESDLGGPGSRVHGEVGGQVGLEEAGPDLGSSRGPRHGGVRVSLCRTPPRCAGRTSGGPTTRAWPAVGCAWSDLARLAWVPRPKSSWAEAGAE
jgi:hypothetical protein